MEEVAHPSDDGQIAPQKASIKMTDNTLDDLLNDGRLARLFSKDARHCALQIWILQIKSEQSIENRVVYGRLLPYSHSSGTWSASDDDNFETIGEIRAQVIRINLYIKSAYCPELLHKLTDGRTISAISDDLKLVISDKLKARFGTVALAADKLVYRPVAYLFNRDAHDRRSLSSPHGGAGAFSASITQTNKQALFRLGHYYDSTLAELIVKQLNTDTGLDFCGADTARLGDLELMVFPALDDEERPLLRVSWADTPPALAFQFNPIQVPHFTVFQFRLNIENDNHIVHSKIATAEREEGGAFECKFELSGQLRARTDSTELEIFGFHDADLRDGTLCCRWRVGYIREIHIQGFVGNRGANLTKFDWLEHATRPAMSARVKAALTINRDNLGFNSQIGGREVDPWVPANRDLLSLFSRLHPIKSEGRFFMQWGKGDGTGRLQFVEWFRSLLAEHQQHQVIIFDPYFGNAGLGLLLLSAAPNSDYIIFTSFLKPPKQDEAMQSETDKPNPDRISNLLASCEHSKHLLSHIKLRIYGLKEGRLHDRYILIVGSDNLPVAGFNLSNSLQNAAENYPLLITPIPADVLLKVEQYKAKLVQEAGAVGAKGETNNPIIRLLFNSTLSPTAPRQYEALRFLENAEAGDVLSVWSGEPTLQGLCGDPLRDRMSELGLLKDNTLIFLDIADFRKFLRHQKGDFVDFAATWKVLGDILAHSSHTDSHFIHRLDFESGFLEFLARFLETSFNRLRSEADRELATIDARLFREPVETLLRSSYYPHSLFHATKYTALTWSEYFTIKFLWAYAPDNLLAIAEAQMISVPVEPQGPDAIRLSLLSQIVSEIALSLQFDVDEIKLGRLIRCKIGLLQWVGLHAIERGLEKPGGLAAAQEAIAAFSHPEQVQFLGWMTHRAAGNQKPADIYEGLVKALHSTLPNMINADDLMRLVDSMRGHMRQLSWVGPWLFQDVVSPLLREDRATIDDACEIWVQELANLIDPTHGHQTQLFNREREGQTTNIAAFLFANSSPGRQQVCLKLMKAILRRQQRIVRQPLASTSDWTRWDSALVASFWILVFTRLCWYYTHGRGTTNLDLEELSLGVRELAMVRPMNEWRGGAQGELVALLDQVEDLLAPNDNRKCNNK